MHRLITREKEKENPKEWWTSCFKVIYGVFHCNTRCELTRYRDFPRWSAVFFQVGHFQSDLWAHSFPISILLY